MYSSVTAFDLVTRGWRFVIEHREHAVRLALVPALLWLVLKIVIGLRPDAPSLLATLADGVIVLFAIDWFRFALGRQGPAKSRRRFAPRALPGRLARCLGRSLAIVLLSTLILLPPTFLLAGATLFLFSAPISEDSIREAVALAMPVSMLLVSPILVRFYAYYATLVAGRRDLSARDVWRWTQGNSISLVALLLMSLGPGLLMVMLAEALQGSEIAAVLGHLAAAAVLFPSVAVMATATARSMGGLLVPPVVMADQATA